MTTHRSIRILIYVQHLLGIGHLMRAGRISSALTEQGFKVTLVTGGMPLPDFKPHVAEHIELPPIAIRDGDFSKLLDVDGNAIDEEYRQRRRQLLLHTYERCRPHAVMLEAFPFGRRQVRFELLPLIERIEASAEKPLLLSSVRDVLQKRVKPERDQETVRLVRGHFDQVLVHGDPAFTTLDESFPLAAEIHSQIVYTGLVSGKPPSNNADSFDIVVSAGGGAVGAGLVSASLDAAELLPDRSWCVITGPNLSDTEFDRLLERAAPNVTLVRFRRDFTDLLGATQLSISQAGYNTVNDVLQAKCRALLIPYKDHGETEQMDRAERLDQLGLVHTLPDESLSGKQLATVIRDILSRPAVQQQLDLNLDGAIGTANILRQLVEEKLLG